VRTSRVVRAAAKLNQLLARPFPLSRTDDAELGDVGNAGDLSGVEEDEEATG